MKDRKVGRASSRAGLTRRQVPSAPPNARCGLKNERRLKRFRFDHFAARWDSAPYLAPTYRAGTLESGTVGRASPRAGLARGERPHELEGRR